MNNRFKFRFFNEYSNKLEPCDEYDLKDIFESGNPVMQCTGLKDKNGTLIYEGDIVEVQYIGGQIPLFKNEFSQEPETERFEIFCHPEWLKFYAKNDNYRKTCEIHSLDLEKIRVNDYNKVYEVIGNIYENKELLDE